MRNLYIVCIFIFVFGGVAGGQTAVNYQFLEVVDWQEKPVADATVETFGYRQSLKTDEKGRVEKLPILYGDDNTLGFTVSKTGYYSFRYEFDYGYSRQKPLRLELLKIPQTRAERALIENEQRKREFFAAARRADVETVRKFLKSGLSPNLSTSDLRGVPTEKDIPIIVLAAKSGDGQTVNEFLKADVDVRKIPDILITYLYAYPFTNRFPANDTEKKELLKAYEDTAEKLIKAGANINPSDSAQTTVLIVATGRGYLRTVKLLIEKGASVDAKEYYGGTALTQAITYLPDSKTRIEMTDLLLKSGADVNLVTRYFDSCRTALMTAAFVSDVETVKFLLANRADVNVTCENGDTALKLLKNRGVWNKSDKIREMIELFEAAGAR